MPTTVAKELRDIGERLIEIATSMMPEKEVSYEEIRKLLADKARKGYQSEIKELLTKHGAEKLSEIDKSKYPALMKEAEVLG